MHTTLTLPVLLCAVLGCETAAANTAEEAPSPSSSPSEGAKATLNVTVRGLRSTEGGLIAFLYDSEDSFPKDFDQALQKKRRSSLSATSATLRFKNLDPGTYALVVVHDENGNGEMDKNMLGFPKEGVGASNVKKGRPKWSRAKFTIEQRGDVTVSMQYF